MQTLERSLLHRAVELDLSDVEDLTTRTVMLRTLRGGLLADRPVSAMQAPAPIPAGVDPEIHEILAQGSGRIHGTDASPAMIEAAVKAAKDAGASKCTFEGK